MSTDKIVVLTYVFIISWCLFHQVQSLIRDLPLNAPQESSKSFLQLHTRTPLYCLTTFFLQLHTWSPLYCLTTFLSTTPYRDTIVLLNQSLAHIVEGGENKGWHQFLHTPKIYIVVPWQSEGCKLIHSGLPNCNRQSMFKQNLNAQNFWRTNRKWSPEKGLSMIM